MIEFRNEKCSTSPVPTNLETNSVLMNANGAKYSCFEVN